ncbi:MAG: serine/threonine-protein kinase [Halolamina sp.]
MKRRGATRRRFLRVAGGTAVGGLWTAASIGQTTAQSAPRLDEQWTRIYGEGDDELVRFESVTAARDGGYLVAGGISSNGSGSGRLMKIDPDGATQWAETHSRGDADRLISAVETGDGGVLTVGTTNFNFGEDGDGLVVKTALDGTAQWVETYGGSEAEWFRSATETSDGGYLVAGRTESKGSGMGDGWLIKLGTDGGVQWERVMGGESNHDDLLSGVIETSEGEYLAAGARKANLNGIGWLVKLDSDGETQWERTYGGSENTISRLPSVVDTSDGGYLAAGNGEVNGYGSNVGWLLKTDRDGTLQWERGYGDSDDALADVIETDDGFLAAGSAEDGENAWDGWVVAAGSDGTAQWAQSFDNSSEDGLESVVETSDGGYLVAGETYENGSMRGWLLKLGQTEVTTTTGPGTGREKPNAPGTTAASDAGGVGEATELLPVALGVLGLGSGLWLYARQDDDGGSVETTTTADAGGAASAGETPEEPLPNEATDAPPSSGETGESAHGTAGSAPPGNGADAVGRRGAWSVPGSIPGAPDIAVDYDALTDEEPIGSGGNADVTRATVETPSKDVSLAIKKPRMSGTLHTENVERLLEEAETWAKLDDHDHVVSVVDYGDTPVPWIAMEYMDGGDLRARAAEMSVDQKLWTATVITKGVHHAHRRGIAHLDLKPANVLFRIVEGAWDVPKVSDWGLSKRLLDHSKSAEGFSPQYAAPEQFSDNYGSADDVTDVYQLGALFYALFTGRSPFDGDPAEVMYQALNDDPTPPSEIADVPAELDEILLTALATEKADRYDGVLLLRNALRDVSGDL